MSFVVFFYIYRLRLMPPTPLRRVPSFSELFSLLEPSIYAAVSGKEHHTHTDRQTDR